MQERARLPLELSSPSAKARSCWRRSQRIAWTRAGRIHTLAPLRGGRPARVGWLALRPLQGHLTGGVCGAYPVRSYLRRAGIAVI